MATPKTKASKKKIRRWQYIVHVVKGEQKGDFQPPALTIGTSANAHKAAEDIQKDMASLPQFEGATVTVEPVGFEVVSKTTLNQITGLGDEIRLVTLALKESCIDILTWKESLLDEAAEHLTPEAFDTKVTTMIGEYAKVAKRKFFDAKAEELGAEAVASTSELNAEGLRQDPDVDALISKAIDCAEQSEVI